MTDQKSPGNEPEEGGVLRPFSGAPTPDLPSVEPSRVVPEPPVPEPPATPPPPPPSQPAAVETEWAPQDVAAQVDEPPQEDPVEYASAAVAGSLPDAAPAANTITLPKKPFLIGLGVMLASLLLLVVLWQGAGGDDSSIVASDAAADEGDTSPVDSAPEEDEPAPPEETDVQAPATDSQSGELQDARAEIEALNAEIEALESRPAPPIDGDAMRRISLSSDAKFLDALEDSVAVVDAFGGVALIDPATNRLVATGSVASASTRVLRTASSVWLTSYADNKVMRLNPATNVVDASFDFIGPDGIEKDGDSLIVASYDGELVARIDPSTGALLQAVEVGGSPTAILSHPDHGLWAAVFDTGEIVEIDRDSFEIVQRIVVGQGPVGLSADQAYLWVTNNQEGTVAKVDPATGTVEWTAAVGAGPTEAVSVNGSVWVTVTDDGTLVQLGRKEGEVITRTPLGGAIGGGGPTGIDYANGSLWIAMQGEQSVVRIEVG